MQPEQAAEGLLKYLDPDSVPGLDVLTSLNRLGFVTQDSQPGRISEEMTDRVPMDTALMNRCITECIRKYGQEGASRIDEEYVRRKGTFTSIVPQPSVMQRAYVTGVMLLPVDAVVAISVKVNQAGMVAYTSLKPGHGIPVTFQSSNHTESWLYRHGAVLHGNIPDSTRLWVTCNEFDDEECEEGRVGIVAFDAQYGRLAYEPGGLFHVVLKAMREVLEEKAA